MRLTCAVESVSSISRWTGTDEATWNIGASACRTTPAVVSCALVDIYVNTGQEDMHEKVALNCGSYNVH